MRLSSVLKDEVVLPIDIDGEVLTVTYDPNEFTIELAETFEENGNSASAVGALLATILKDWDLEDDTGVVLGEDWESDSRRVPCTVQYLKKVPLSLLSVIFIQIRDDQRPSEEEGKASGAGSAQTGRSVSRQDGSFS